MLATSFMQASTQAPKFKEPDEQNFYDESTHKAGMLSDEVANEITRDIDGFKSLEKKLETIEQDKQALLPQLTSKSGCEKIERYYDGIKQVVQQELSKCPLPTDKDWYASGIQVYPDQSASIVAICTRGLQRTLAKAIKTVFPGNYTKEKLDGNQVKRQYGAYSYNGSVDEATNWSALMNKHQPANSNMNPFDALTARYYVTEDHCLLGSTSGYSR